MSLALWGRMLLEQAKVHVDSYRACVPMSFAHSDGSGGTSRLGDWLFRGPVFLATCHRRQQSHLVVVEVLFFGCW
jgi:hypothetical protein